MSNPLGKQLRTYLEPQNVHSLCCSNATHFVTLPKDHWDPLQKVVLHTAQSKIFKVVADASSLSQLETYMIVQYVIIITGKK